MLTAHSSSLTAKSFLQNSSPAFGGFCRSARARRGRRKFRRRTFLLPASRPVRRCAWLRRLSADSGFAFREEEALRLEIEMPWRLLRIQARRAGLMQVVLLPRDLPRHLPRSPPVWLPV